MKAKCPHCESGCDRCKDGFIQVGMACGELYTRHCNGCGKDNGGRIVNDELPPLPDSPGDCVWCGSPDVRWQLVGLLG